MGGELGHFADHAVVESVLGGVGGDVAEGFDFAGEPGIAAALDVVGDEAIEEEKDHQGAEGKGQRGPGGDAPGSAVHRAWFSGL